MEEKKEPTPYTARVCRTTYVEENGQHAARVKAVHVTTKARKFAVWDESLDLLENHLRAAKLVLGKRPEVVASEDGGGFLCIAATEACRLVLLGESDAQQLSDVLGALLEGPERPASKIQRGWLGRMREALGGGGAP